MTGYLTLTENSDPDDHTRRERERVLSLDFECLKSIPEGINEVRVWWDRLLDCYRVGKRFDLSSLDHGEVLPEPATLQKIRHKHVVSVLAAVNVKGFSAPLRVIELITEYYPRGSITDALLSGETFTATEAVRITQAALRGLAELHEVHGIAHRDVKSGNILLTQDSSVAKIADLGLAGEFDTHGAVPALENPTLYSPLELVTTKSLTRASDIYPFALILRELLGGALPYEKYSRSDVVTRLSRNISPVSAEDARLPIWTPRDLRRIVKKAGQRQQRDRYQTARDMDQALSAAMIADWREAEPLVWEAPFRHIPGRDVQVSATKKRNGGYVLSIKVRRNSGWRKSADDTYVRTLESADARRAFDQATAIANAR